MNVHTMKGKTRRRARARIARQFVSRAGSLLRQSTSTHHRPLTAAGMREAAADLLAAAERLDPRAARVHRAALRRQGRPV